jgi:hypothetical protein
VPFYGDLDAYCPPATHRFGLRRMLAYAICLMALGVVVVL